MSVSDRAVDRGDAGNTLSYDLKSRSPSQVWQWEKVRKGKGFDLTSPNWTLSGPLAARIEAIKTRRPSCFISTSNL